MKSKIFAILVFAFTAGTGICLAQADLAAVIGTISDQSHAAIVSAHVAVVYPATGLQREALSSSSGIYEIAELPIGECYLEVSAPGFRTVQTKPFALTVHQTRNLDVTLAVAGTASTVEVRDIGDPMTYATAEVSSLTTSQRLNDLPVNGRNWMSFMALAPGAVDKANGANSSVLFFSATADDENYREDGLDATSIRNQNMRLNSRLLMSEDAIAEFRVTSALGSADTGGSIVGQVQIITKSGSNAFHGSAFEYARNDVFDAAPFNDTTGLPPFHFNQYGGSVGGPIIKDRTFFFLSYEGLRQTQDLQAPAQDVPSLSFDARALAESPVIAPLLAAYPKPTGTTSNPDIGTWVGPSQNNQDEDVGTLRIDNKFNNYWSGFFHFTRNHATTLVPETLNYSIASVNAPWNAALGLTYVVSPRSVNDLRLGINWVPWDYQQSIGNVLAVAVGPLVTAPDSLSKLTHSASTGVLDNYSHELGRHTLKAGVEVRHVIITNYYSYDGTISYASMDDFAANIVDSVVDSGLNPLVGDYKTEAFGYVEDEWKVRPNFTVSPGLRYDFFNELGEEHGHTYGFNFLQCGGYCPLGTRNGSPDKTNIGPHLALAWAPQRLQGNTVFRVGSGIYYGDGQIGNQLAFTYNWGDRFDLTQATNPGLSYPVNLTANLGVGTAPDETDRNRRSEMSQQWTAQIQQRLPQGVLVQASYLGMETAHTFDEQEDNVINPLTGQQPYPNFNIVEHKGDFGVSRYNALMIGLERTAQNGLYLAMNYAFAHALGDNQDPENVACRACSFGPNTEDVRDNYYVQANYPLPFDHFLPLGHVHPLRGWSLSGVGSFRTGLPLNVTVSRKSTVMADGNSTNQRPDRIPGVSLIPPGGRTIQEWINLAAFAVPAKDTWGDASPYEALAPALVQVDSAIQKMIPITEGTNLKIRMEAFNAFNRRELGNPNLNFSSPSFGQITSVSNTTPVGSGTPRSIQFAARFTF
ncbi:MAG TPA: carboxypeptidase regulatory-like domain-containing protein [Acidobacteriaceae bacterium]|nr:carboxypeptidase regulatory-like domain-containing protein [Acidobacteriaceae bacterium]